MSQTDPPQPGPKPEEILFSAALKRPSAERPAFLDAACRGDAALRRRLEVLLGMHELPDALPELPEEIARPEISAVGTEGEDFKGRRVGRYTLLEMIGEGGCGVVYAAEQTEPVRRRVALKLIKPGMNSKAVIARFEAERQALALMDHPNIAKVLDGGTTDAGLPYFVMELVRGLKITEYCDQHKLSTQERLKLFIQVCQAVQHAHQKGIIHRDLKPSNVLVTVQGDVVTPKVIDFGIAKAIGSEPLTDKTLYTALDQFIGTPAYMSPEQAAHGEQAVDARTDVYSLGVLLYELLTGHTPFDTQALLASGFEHMLKTIRLQEPPRPSSKLSTLDLARLTVVANRRRVEPPKLAHQLRGDLDWIVVKCLEKDRDRRYESADGLGMDLRRHLEHQPVRVCPPSIAYRFQKLIRRKPVPFLIGSAVVIGLLVGLLLNLRYAPPGRETIVVQEPQLKGYGPLPVKPAPMPVSGTTRTVLTTADNGSGSLRDAIEKAEPGDTVLFSPNLSGQTIALTNGQINLHRSLSLNASGLNSRVRISGSHSSRIFQVMAGVTIKMDGLTLADGRTDGQGGAIFSSGSLFLNDCVLTNNYGQYGGALHQEAGLLSLNHCLVAYNSAQLEAGGIYNTSFRGNPKANNQRSTLLMQNCTIANNSAEGLQGGGIKTYLGAVIAINCTIAGNAAATEGGGLRAYASWLLLTNCVLSGNIGGTTEQMELSVQMAEPGGTGNFIGPNAMLLPLGDYGGSMETMLPLPGSPLIDTGYDVVSEKSTDQRHLPRIVGPHRDVGAVEFQGSADSERLARLWQFKTDKPATLDRLFNGHRPEDFNARNSTADRLIADQKLSGAKTLLSLNLRDLNDPGKAGDREVYRGLLKRFVVLCRQAGQAREAALWETKLLFFDAPFAFSIPEKDRLSLLARAGRFAEAAALLPKPGALPKDILLAVKYCALAVEAGDFITYSNYCMALQQQTLSETDKPVFRRLSRACLLAPLSLPQTQKAAELAERAALPENFDKQFGIHILCGQGLARLRMGKFEEALATFREMTNQIAVASGVWPWPQSHATATALIALCWQHLGQVDAARTALAEARVEFQPFWGKVGKADLTSEWQDTLILHCLLREAELAIEPPKNLGQP